LRRISSKSCGGILPAMKNDSKTGTMVLRSEGCLARTPNIAASFTSHPWPAATARLLLSQAIRRFSSVGSG